MMLQPQYVGNPGFRRGVVCRRCGPELKSQRWSGRRSFPQRSPLAEGQAVAVFVRIVFWNEAGLLVSISPRERVGVRGKGMSSAHSALNSFFAGGFIRRRRLVVMTRTMTVQMKRNRKSNERIQGIHSKNASVSHGWRGATSR